MSLIAFGLWAAKLLRASHAKCLAALLLQKKKKKLFDMGVFKTLLRVPPYCIAVKHE